MRGALEQYAQIPVAVSGRQRGAVHDFRRAGVAYAGFVEAGLYVVVFLARELFILDIAGTISRKILEGAVGHVFRIPEKTIGYQAELGADGVARTPHPGKAAGHFIAIHDHVPGIGKVRLDLVAELTDGVAV